MGWVRSAAFACLLAGGCARSPLAPPSPDLAPSADLGPLPAPICDAPPDAGQVGCDDGHWRWRGPKPVELSNFDQRFGWRAPDGEAWIVAPCILDGPQWCSTVILHWDGARFAVEWRDTAIAFPDGLLRSIWGSSRDDLWAVGADRLVLHSAGDGCWERLPVPLLVDLVDVKGRARDDAWAIGASGTALHWDGIGWNYVPTGVTDLVGLAVVDGAEWIISQDGDILRWDGASWQVDQKLDVALQSIWADSATDAWVVGEHDTVLHWDGTGWHSIPSSTTSCSPGWSGANEVSGNAPDDVCIFCDNHDVHWNGSAFVQESCGSFDPAWKQLLSVEDFVAVSALGPSEAWAVSHGGAIYGFNGAAWNMVHQASDSLSAIFARTSDDVWAGGNTILDHWDGTAWSEMSLANFAPYFPVGNIWASGPDDVWVTSLGATWLIHFDGGQWNKIDLGKETPGSRVWGTASDDVWVLGYSTTPAAHFDGTSWQSFPTTMDKFGGAINDVWGTDSKHIWAAGIYGLLRWDGSTWSRIDLGIVQDLAGVRGTSDDDLWLIRESNRSGVQYWDGHQLQCSTESYQGLRAMGGTPDNMWVVGAGGTILHRE